MGKTKLKKGDVVRVIAGSHRGNQGPITWISRDKRLVSLQGIETTKHVKPSNADTEGGIKKIPAKLNLSNVAILEPKNKKQTTRIGFIFRDGKKIRVSHKTNHEIK